MGISDDWFTIRAIREATADIARQTGQSVEAVERDFRRIIGRYDKPADAGALSRALAESASGAREHCDGDGA